MKLLSSSIMAMFLFFGGLYALRHEIVAPEDSSVELDRRLFTFEKSDLREFEFISPRSKYRLVRAPGRSVWQIERSGGFHVRPSDVETLLGTLLSFQIENSFELAGRKKSEFGLEKPKYEILYRTSYAKEGRLLFGDLHSFSTRRYATIEGGKEIFLLDDAALQVFRRSEEDLRDKRPFMGIGELAPDSIVLRTRNATEKRLDKGQQPEDFEDVLEAFQEFRVLSYFKIDKYESVEPEFSIKLFAGNRLLGAFSLLEEIEAAGGSEPTTSDSMASDKAPNRGVVTFHTGASHEVIFSFDEAGKLRALQERF